MQNASKKILCIYLQNASEFQILIMNTTKKRSDCPVSNSLEEWGDKWSLLIIRDLMFHKERTYGDFLKTPEKIATNILASRLQALEENGIITKIDYPEGRSRFLYKLTEKGIQLVPVLVEINLWAEKYYPIPEERKEMMEQIHADKEVFIRKTIDDLID